MIFLKIFWVLLRENSGYLRKFTNFAIAKCIKRTLAYMNELIELKKDTDGLLTYDYIVNHVEECEGNMDFLTENLRESDNTGQYLSSSARFLSSIDRERFMPWISRMIEGAIERDRERRYIWSLLKSIWGEDYESRVDELREQDDNFRKIYKRVYPESQESAL